MKKSEDPNFIIKHWTPLTIFVLAISIILICFSFFAPTIFVKNANNLNLDFSNTGQIGDTIGGIMNPFLTMAGILLTFLAFYMQIKANETQIKLFNKSITNSIEFERSKKIGDDKEQVELLIFDLESILKDLTIKSEIIEKFTNSCLDNPLKSNILTRTSSNSLKRPFLINRVSIFNYMKLNAQEYPNWLKEYYNIYYILDFIPDFFEDLYSKTDALLNSTFEEKNRLRIKINSFYSNFENIYFEARRTRISDVESLNAAFEKFRISYSNEIKSTLDENNIPVQESNFETVGNYLMTFYSDLKPLQSHKFSFVDISNLMSQLREFNYEINHNKKTIVDYAQKLKIEMKNIDSTENEHSILKTLESKIIILNKMVNQHYLRNQKK